MGPSDEIDFVGHSLGGLVARYYVEVIHGGSDGPIGSISMLGTPNEGVWAAKFGKWVCPAVAVTFGPLAGIACAVRTGQSGPEWL